MPKEPDMTDVYAKLARHLDTFPAGFPPTDSGVELKILKHLFTEEEAAITLALTMIPEAASAIAQRTEWDEEALSKQLDLMSRKGLLFRISKGNRPLYSASQFVIGIWEYHLKALSPELIADVNEYLPHIMKKRYLKLDTKQLRVIPISREITGTNEILPYETAEDIIRSQRKIVISECICRKEHQMMGKGCDNPLEACFSFGSGAYYYEENGLGRAIDTEEALKILETGRKAGLVLQPGNAQRPSNICMCCGCCCQVLKNLKTLEKPALVVHTNYFARVDETECIGCGACADRCHMDAISLEETAMVNPDRCIGCGVCVPVCPTGAVSLDKKAEDDQYIPPETVFETYMSMARDRKIIDH